MNERLTIQDLTDLLAAKHSMTKKDAEAFVKEFFLLVEQALQTDKTVKIRGLGTFKLIDVDSRESVNVNTGERFQIKGHTKVSFTADPNLRDTINKPFAHFETVVLNENTVLDDTPIEETEEEETIEENLTPTVEETANEEIIIEKEQAAEEEEEEDLVAEEDQQPQEIAEEPETMTAEQIIEQELLKANLKPEIPTVPSPELETVHPAESGEENIPPVTKKDIAKKEKSPVPYLIAVIVIVVLLCGSVVLFIYYPDLLSSPSDKNALEMPPVATTTQPVRPDTQLSDTIERKDTVAEVVATSAAPQPAVETKPVVPKEKAVTSVKAQNPPVQQQQPSASAYPDSASYKITGTKTKYTIKEGETLTRVSLRFYGTKAMWPYIVKHNPTVIKNPDNVPYGTTIKIPELTKE